MGAEHPDRRTSRMLFSIMAAVAFAVALLLAVEAYKAEPAQAHKLGHHSVRGGNIRYADGPDFDFVHARSWAVGQWNRLPRIPIVRDTSSTDRDLEFRQYPGTSGPFQNDHAYYDYTRRTWTRSGSTPAYSGTTSAPTTRRRWRSTSSGTRSISTTPREPGAGRTAR